MTTGAEGFADQITTMDQLPLISRLRVVMEGASVNKELHDRGIAMLIEKGLDPSIGDIIIGDPNPVSDCKRGTVAEALAMGHGNLDNTFTEAIKEAEEEGVNRDVAAFRSIRAFASKTVDPKTGAEQLLTVGAEPRDNSQDTGARDNLKKNNQE